MSVYERTKRMTAEQVIAAQRATREAAEREEREAQEERDRRNAETRKAYLATLEAKRAAERAKSEAEVDRQLEPEKTRAKNAWLAAHPDKTPADFEATWTARLRPNAVQDLERQAGEATKQTLRATGEYSF
jgi:hypothetical protein